MHNISEHGPLRVVAYRQGRKVPIATIIGIGDIEIEAPAEPRLLLVPQNVASLQKMWDAVRMPGRNNLLVTGESGSGKTTLVRYLGEIYRNALVRLAEREQDPRQRAHLAARAASFQTRILTFHENLRRSDITERRHYGESGEERTGWTMSDVMDGMVAGDWNVLSEINRTGEDVQAEFNEPLENKAKSLHQRVIRGHADTRFIATTNPVKSEGRGIYEGRVMSGEFVNRFTNKVQLSYLPTDQEFEVLKDYGPGVDDTIIGRLLALSNDIRRDYAEEHGVVPFPVTPRALIRVVRHLERFPCDARALRSLFWRKAYWLDDRIHPAVARRLVENLLDLHDIHDINDAAEGNPGIIHGNDGGIPSVRIGGVTHELGPGGPYVPDTVIEEVQQNVADLSWILKDISLGENILLIGEAGVGKNKLESYLAHLLNWNLLVVGMSGETRVSDLLTYRSFGEEEAGRTGDTATIGLRALTDEVQRWLIVLDEANKAHPGVLVSFNDLLQDRIVRLPGGTEAKVRAAICVNINPNRPPYEVNDFSFEFMDRFSIHTIVHLPAEQAVLVLSKKYPGADIDFIRDVVNGFYALHPLYSSGILFEPVTMRNEEAAIERGLQYPYRACNLIDVICSGYSPRDAREQKAIAGALEAAGFDRDVLPASEALVRYRSAWEADTGNEEAALVLAETYRKLGKPTAALEVYTAMLSRHPAHDWMFRLRRARILLEGGDGCGAGEELKRAFPVCGTIRLMNGEKYGILSSRTWIAGDNTQGISIEARNRSSGKEAFIVSGEAGLPQLLRRTSGEYVFVSRDPGHGLSVYERVAATADEKTAISSPGHNLCDLVREFTRLVPGGLAFPALLTSLPSPPWNPPTCDEGTVIREIPGAIRLWGDPDTRWSALFLSGTGETKVSWTCGTDITIGLPGNNRTISVASAVNPLVHLASNDGGGILYLVVSCNLPADVSGSSGSVAWTVMPSGAYREKILVPRASLLRSRLLRLFRYARPLSASRTPGAGDVLYTLRPDSRIGISLVIDTDGIKIISTDLDSGEFGVHSQPAGPPYPSGIQRMIVPLSWLDTGEERLEAALLPETQAFIGELRNYTSTAFMLRTRPRDLAFEAKARSILAGLQDAAEPVTAIKTVLARGDILVRAGSSGDDPRSVFIVRFIQEDHSGGPLLVRGFWLAEPGAVATEHFDQLAAGFGRIVVSGDDRNVRIVMRLIDSCQGTTIPWQFSREGTGFNPVDRFSLNGLTIEHHPADRRFRLEFPADTDGTLLTVDETGYPVETTTIAIGGSEVSSWKGLPLVDVQFQPHAGIVMVIVEDDLARFLGLNRMTGNKPVTPTDYLEFNVISRTCAIHDGLIPGT